MPHQRSLHDTEEIEFWRVSRRLRIELSAECTDATETALRLAFWAKNPSVKLAARELLGERLGLRCWDADSIGPPARTAI